MDRFELRKERWRDYLEGMDPVVIFQTFNLGEAQLMRSRLEGAGIDAEVQHEASATNLDVAAGGVRLVVRADQAEEARALIHDKPE